MQINSCRHEKKLVFRVTNGNVLRTDNRRNIKNKIMMKFKLYLFSAILAVMPFISGGCSNKNVSYEDAGTVWSGLFSNHDSKTVRKTLSLKNFHGINVVSAAQVYYTQGSEYKVEFEGRSCDFNNLSFKVSDGILVVGFSKKNNWKDIGSLNCKLYITAPRIDRIACSGSFSFRAKTLKTGSLTVSNSGALRLYINQLKTGSCRMSNSGALTNNGVIDAGSFDLSNSGAYNSSAQMKVSGDMSVSNNGSNSISGDIEARNLYWRCYGADKCEIGINAKNVDFYIDGSGKINGKFKGDVMSIKCNGAAKVNMDVDCLSVTASVNGTGNIALSGTADKIDIGGSGISRIDTSRLNNFE
mgnify:FL=1